MNSAATFEITQATHAFGGAALVLIALILLFVALGLVITAFWVWMLVDCANSPMVTSDKTAWILIILFTNILGAVLYFFIPRGERMRAARTTLARDPSALPPTTC